MRLGAVALASLTACLTIPEFKGTTGGTDGMSVTTESDQSHTVNGPGYSLHFPARGFHYPDAWVIGPDQVLHAVEPSLCADESTIGIAVVPSHRIDASGTPIQADVTVLVEGLSVAKLALDWRDQLDCAVEIAGRSTFTLMPDGRIVRHDVVEAPASDVDAASCGCTASSAWLVTSYVALDRSMFSQVVDHALDPITPSDSMRADQIVCASGGAHAIAAAWSGATTRVRDPDPDSTALIYDFLDPKPAMIGPATTIDPVTSAYLIGTQCAPLVDTLVGFGTEAVLAVNGAHVGTATDGIYGGEDDQGHAGITTTEVTTLAAVTKPLPAGFVVWLDFGVTRSSFSITNPAETGDDWFLIGRPAQGGDHQLVIWFRDELPLGQTITIAAGND